MRLQEYLDPENALGFTRQTLGRLADTVHDTMMDPSSMVDSFSDVASGAVDMAQGAGRLAHDVMMDPGKMIGALTEMHPMDTAALVTAPFGALGDVTEVANMARREFNDDETDDPEAWEYPLVAAPGGLAIFAGRKARNAQLDKLSKAEEMSANGFSSRDDIWKDTGWFEDVDGNWKFEIDDSGLDVKPSGNPDVQVGPGSKTATTGYSAEIPVDFNKHVTHGKLMENYPDVADAGLTYTSYPDGGGYLGPVGKFKERYYVGAAEKGDEFARPGEPRSILAHELQHGIQRREGFASGGSSDEFVYDKINDISPSQQYKHLAGEAEARNVETRLGMTLEERAATPPWETLDIPEDDLNVRFKRDGIRAMTPGLTGVFDDEMIQKLIKRGIIKP